MTLYLPREQLLFSGDHILFDITPNISVWHQVPHSLEDYFDSLGMIRTLPIRATFPAHRSSEGDAHQRVKELMVHHAQRLAEIYQAVAAHPNSMAYQIAGRIKWSARGGLHQWGLDLPNRHFYSRMEKITLGMTL